MLEAAEEAVKDTAGPDEVASSRPALPPSPTRSSKLESQNESEEMAEAQTVFDGEHKGHVEAGSTTMSEQTELDQLGYTVDVPEPQVLRASASHDDEQAPSEAETRLQHPENEQDLACEATPRMLRELILAHNGSADHAFGHSHPQGGSSMAPLQNAPNNTAGRARRADVPSAGASDLENT